MPSHRRKFLVIFVLFASATLAFAQAPKPLQEADLVKLINLGIGDDAIVAKMAKDGLAGKADDGMVERLRQAGASETVIKAVQQAGETKPPAKPTITYQQVLELLQLGIDEDAILKKLAASP